MSEYNSRQLVKRRFYALRNGVLADRLRRSGSPYKIIFGLNLPQIKEVAAEFAGDVGLLSWLRADVRCRESCLIAPMLTDVDTLTAADAASWLASVQTVEEADVLCHSLLRRHPDAARIGASILASAPEGPLNLKAYSALRLLGHLPAATLSPEIIAQVRSRAANAVDCATIMLCNNILDSIE